MFLKKREKWGIFAILVGLFCMNVFAGAIVYDLSKPSLLKVVFFDVGQGDAVFIETPQHHQILIDGGPGPVILRKLAKELPFYDRSLDLIILTHPEKDHISGLIDVLESYKINKILWTGVVRNTDEWKAWNKLINKEGAEIKIARAGQVVIFGGKGPKALLNILYPFENLEGKYFKNSNETSVVAKLVLGKKSFLFTGDIGKPTERKLIEKDIDSDILKVAHHGSKNSSSKEFLENVSPEFAVIQVGENKYGHPHLETLTTLSQLGIKTLRTDKKGDIKIECQIQNCKCQIKFEKNKLLAFEF